jgi:putative FmdB family regulatory protein
LPVYEYRCTKDHVYEKTESFSAPSVQKCTVCGARARRQISMPAVIFKGSGFYSTDNRGSGSKGGRTSSSDGDSTPAPGTDTKASDNGHGHSHGTGGHTHDTTPAKVDASA